MKRLGNPFGLESVMSGQPSVEDWRNFSRCSSNVKPFDELEKKSSQRNFEAAREVCKACVARMFCLDDALSTNAQGKMLGAKTLIERNEILADREVLDGLDFAKELDSVEISPLPLSTEK